METTKSNKNYLEAKAISDKQIRCRKALQNYGIIPFLMTLQRFESEEKYKDCQLITNTIKRHNLTNYEKLPLKLTPEYYDSEVKYFEIVISKKEILEIFKLRAEQCYKDLTTTDKFDPGQKIHVDFNPCSDPWINSIGFKYPKTNKPL